MGLQSLFSIIIQTVITFPVFFAIAIGLPVLAILWALFGKNKRWGSAAKPAFFLALLAGVAAFVGLPYFFRSSFSDISYLTDWLFHISSVIAVMIYTFVVFWCFLAPNRQK